MRLIGGKDFYDSALAYGRDERTVFVRHKDKRIERKECPIAYPLNVSVYGLKTRWGKSDESLRAGKLIIAGKLYPFVVFEADMGGHCEWSRRVCFTLESFLAELHHRGGKLSGSKWHQSHPFYDGCDRLSPRELDWLVENRVTILYSDREFGSRDEFWRVDPYTLTTLQANRHLNPFNVFQEISMWVSGVLANNGPKLIEIHDDDVKLAKHGFNRQSFRRMKKHKHELRA